MDCRVKPGNDGIISGRKRELPEGYHWPRRVVGGQFVWLGFAACVRQGLMLFNSWLFILVFLPVVLTGYFVLGRSSNVAAVIWLALASLAFYSFSNWQFVLL